MLKTFNSAECQNWGLGVLADFWENLRRETLKNGHFSGVENGKFDEVRSDSANIIASPCSVNRGIRCGTASLAKMGQKWHFCHREVLVLAQNGLFLLFSLKNGCYSGYIRVKSAKSGYFSHG